MTALFDEKRLQELLIGAGLTPEEAESFIEEYSVSLSRPDLNLEIIDQLTQKQRDKKVLRVIFQLSPEEYEALVDFYSAKGQSATQLVQRVVEDFISSMS